MNKKEIVDRLVKKSGIKKREIDFIIDGFLEHILMSVENGDKVEIRGFGTFYKAERKQRKVYSPIAGKHLDLPEKTVLAFKASKKTEKATPKGA